MAPSFRVKLQDSIVDIVYKCIIGTNSLSADSSKRSRKTGPSLPKYHFAEGSYNTFERDVTIFAKRHVDL